MRLSDKEHQAIVEVIHKLDPEAKIYLFGSRADDQKRGGDIDLLIISSLITERDRRSLRLNIFDQIGEQKLDLLIAKDASEPCVRIAFK